MTGEPFDRDRMARAYALLDRAVEANVIPGGVALVGVDGGWLPPYAVGRAVDTADHKIDARPDTTYDLASLTKVVATLPAALMLLQDGTADLQEPVAAVLEEWRGRAAKQGITPVHLLTHTSGLPAHLDYYSHGWSPEEIVRRVIAEPLEAPPGARMVYSDLGYILLGEWIRRITGEPLDAWTRRAIYEPLGMGDTAFLPSTANRDRLAAGEYRSNLGRHQWGEVNDDNAWALGGVSGHAGLFSTTRDLARYLDACWSPWRTPPDGPLSPAVVRAALRDYTLGLGARRGLGWSLKGDVWDNSGLLMSEDSFGHTGYTGTSVWVDPATRLKVILLTNRVHASLSPGIVGLRRRFHNAVAAAYGGEVRGRGV